MRGPANREEYSVPPEDAAVGAASSSGIGWGRGLGALLLTLASVGLVAGVVPSLMRVEAPEASTSEHRHQHHGLLVVTSPPDEKSPSRPTLRPTRSSKVTTASGEKGRSGEAATSAGKEKGHRKKEEDEKDEGEEDEHKEDEHKEDEQKEDEEKEKEEKAKWEKMKEEQAKAKKEKAAEAEAKKGKDAKELEEMADEMTRGEVECAKEGKGCIKSHCCVDKGFQCYQRNSTWAACRKVCNPSIENKDLDGKPWSCKKLGERTPGGESASTAASAQCAWEGEDCSLTKCCNKWGLSCYAKNTYFAACHATCKRAIDPSSPEKSWGCEVLGGSRVNKDPVKAVQKSKAMSSSLFCFTVVMRGTYEEGLVWGTQKSYTLGVFGCDEHNVFFGSPAQRGAWKSVVNTDQFITVWGQVKDDGKYLNHNWTVKVDPDAVFFPERLRWHIDQLQAPNGAKLYLKNCDFKFGFMGSLEIFSLEAMKTFFRNRDSCSEHIWHNGGEDFFMMTCMDAIGVRYMKDAALLNDKYTYSSEYSLKDTSACSNGGTVAFHPYKDVGLWMQCHGLALKAEEAFKAQNK